MSEEEPTINIEDLNEEELREVIAMQSHMITNQQESATSEPREPAAAKVNYLKIRTSSIELEMQSPDASNAELVVAAIDAVKHIDKGRELTVPMMGMGMPPSTYV